LACEDSAGIAKGTTFSLLYNISKHLILCSFDLNAENRGTKFVEFLIVGL
jgi:hypothetical protein